MNIFFTDHDPFVAASNLDDKRLQKMVVESAQMLSTNLRLFGMKDKIFYRAAWHNHPSTVWARQSDSNFEWLCLHGIYMCELYSDIYGRQHKTLAVLQHCLIHSHVFPNAPITEFANASLVKGDGADVVEAYRETMCIKWAKDKHRPTWQNRSKPNWYRNLGGMV